MPALRRRAIAAVLLLTPLLWAQEKPTDGPNARRIEQLLPQLSAENWRERQQAQDALVQLGQDARPRLLQLLQTTDDEELRSRVEAALRQIEANRATGTSYITMHLKDATPQQVFAELSRQASTELRVSPPTLWESRAWPRIDIDLERQPFWLAMREICTKVGVAPQNNGIEREMVIMDRQGGGPSWGTAPVSAHGPFMVMATMVNTYASRDFNQPAVTRRSCNINLLVYAEPKIRVLQGSYGARVDEAVDEHEQSWVMPGQQAEGMQPNMTWVWPLSVSLMPPENAGKKLARLKGSGRFVIQTRSEQAEITNVLDPKTKNVTRVVGGKRFTLKEVRRAGDSYIVTLTLYRAGWNPNEWNYMYPQSIFKLLDGAGKPLPRTSNTGGGGGGEQVDISIHFQRQNWAPSDNDTADPVRLVWEVPIETKEVVVPFEFTDLELPS
jgi:hypothetical protein